MEDLIQEVLQRLPIVPDHTAGELPAEFPAVVFDTIKHGVWDAANRLAKMLAEYQRDPAVGHYLFSDNFAWLGALSWTHRA